MTKAPNRLTSLLHRLGVVAPVRVRVFAGSRLSKIRFSKVELPASARGSVLGFVSTLCVVVGALLLTSASALASEGCANEARRVEQNSTFLPDCRAYELVTPYYMPSPAQFAVTEEGRPNSALTGVGPESAPHSREFFLNKDETFLTASDGDALLYESAGANSQSPSARSNLSVRNASGWTGENILPPMSLVNFLCPSGEFVGFSQNLEQIVIAAGDTENIVGRERNPEKCDHPEPPLVPGEPEESGNLFLRDTATGAFQLVNVTPTGVTSLQPHFDAVSADGSYVVFESKARLTSNAPPPPVPQPGSADQPAYATDIYVWNAASVHLLTVLPTGTAIAGGALAGALPRGSGTPPNESAQITHAVSADGERILFYANGEFEPNQSEVGGSSDPDPYFNTPYRGGGVFLREHPAAEQSVLNECTEAEQKAEPGKACTVQIDVPESGASGSAGNGQFRWANAETTKIFFTDEQKLTSDSTAQAGKPDLYEYDLEKPAGDRLTDLTVNAGESADVVGVSGASEDGAYVYFVAKGNLTASQENSHGARAVAGEPNLYLRHAGVTTFIATLNGNEPDRCDWNTGCLTARVSANGLFIGFNSIDSLTGYDNNPVQPNACEIPPGLVPGSPCMEIFRYAADAGAHGELTCASCNPDGSPPAAKYAYTMIDEPGRGYSFVVAPRTIWIAHNVADNGEVFFDTMEKLLRADENETYDVYGYDGGEGSSAQLHLISTGKSEAPSVFYNADPSGSDVFFATAQPLVRNDIRPDYDAYDARVDGGFASQDEAVQPPACGAIEACRSPLSEPPAEFSVASAALSGSGNLVVKPEQPVAKEQAAVKEPAKCKKGFVRKHGKCLRKRHGKQAKHHGKQGRRHGRAGK